MESWQPAGTPDIPPLSRSIWINPRPPPLPRTRRTSSSSLSNLFKFAPPPAATLIERLYSRNAAEPTAAAIERRIILSHIGDPANAQRTVNNLQCKLC